MILMFFLIKKNKVKNSLLYLWFGKLHRAQKRQWIGVGEETTKNLRHELVKIEKKNQIFAHLKSLSLNLLNKKYFQKRFLSKSQIKKNFGRTEGVCPKHQMTFDTRCQREGISLWPFLGGGGVRWRFLNVQFPKCLAHWLTFLPTHNFLPLEKKKNSSSLFLLPISRDDHEILHQNAPRVEFSQSTRPKGFVGFSGPRRA